MHYTFFAKRDGNGRYVATCEDLPEVTVSEKDFDVLYAQAARETAKYLDRHRKTHPHLPRKGAYKLNVRVALT